MSVWLLDVNVLVARFWEPHVFHHKVRAWMAKHENDKWSTCPITQAGFVRTISNPSFSPDAPRPAEAIHWLAETVKQHPGHRFWADDLPIDAACLHTGSRLSGFKHLTDAYLLGLALHRKARFLTLDRRVLTIAPEHSPVRRILDILD